MTDDPIKPDSWLKRYLRTGKHWPIMLVVLFVTQASIVLGTAIVASGPGAKPMTRVRTPDRSTGTRSSPCVCGRTSSDGN